MTLSHPSSPMALTYTMTEGFLLAGSSRAAIEQSLSIRASGLGLASSATFRELLPDNGYTDCSALVYRNLGPIFGALPDGGMGGYEDLLRETAAPGLFCIYGLEDRIIVEGSGPSFASLAPLFGLSSLMAVEEIGDALESVDNPERVSSVS
jgi:hypothetical protein